MAPTICGDANDTNSLREVRKSTVEPTAVFSVINYVGKIQKQRPVKYNSSPYSTQSHLRRMPASQEAGKPTHHTVNQDVQSSPSLVRTINPCGRRQLRMRRRRSDSSRDSIDGDNSSDTDVSFSSERQQEEKNRQDVLKMLQENQFRLMRARSASISSSSGCSSSMEDSPCLSPAPNSRCNTDFEDDGFRDASPQMLDHHHHHHLHHSHSALRLKPIARINTRGLLEIAIKTVRLMQRNQELQAKLNELQSETEAFIESVMLNPENEKIRVQLEAKNK